MNVAGRDLTEYLITLLLEKEYQFISSAEKEVVRKMKEETCYVAYDYEQELVNVKSKNISKSYELPDGQLVSLSEERFQCPGMTLFYGLYFPCFVLFYYSRSLISALIVGVGDTRIG